MAPGLATVILCACRDTRLKGEELEAAAWHDAANVGDCVVYVVYLSGPAGAGGELSTLGPHSLLTDAHRILEACNDRAADRSWRFVPGLDG